IPQLARIKYLYPELADKVIESQYMLCLSYIRTKDIETALTIYNTIRPDLNQHQIAIIESELNASGRN
ncbi:MAG TPA: hypothetical protein PKK33_11370, partial [Candidatus Cloacimonadota bacterium]|nr:hypothetical protein [Candidatus Cloacimonadota bacterium]